MPDPVLPPNGPPLGPGPLNPPNGNQNADELVEHKTPFDDEEAEEEE